MSEEFQYPFSAAMCDAIAVLAVTRPEFWSRVGYAIDPEGISNIRARYTLAACRKIVARTNKAPKPLLVSDILFRWSTLEDDPPDKDLTDEVLESCQALLNGAEDLVNRLDPDQVVEAVRGAVQKEAVRRSLELGYDSWSRGQSTEKARRALDAADRIGAETVTAGVELGDEDLFARMARLRELPYLATGIPEIDAEIPGLLRGNYGVVIAPSGGGKSISLAHMAVEATLAGFAVGYIDLEVGEEQTAFRLLANYSSLPINDIQADPKIDALARQRYAVIRQRPDVGPLILDHFSPNTITVAFVAEWIDRVSDRIGRKLDALFLDYAGLLLSALASSSSHDREKRTSEDLRDVFETRSMWGWSAYQANRDGIRRTSPNKRAGGAGGSGKRTKARIDLADTAGSIGVPQTADLVFTITPEDENRSAGWFVAKNRFGRALFSVGPVPNEFEMGRVAMVSRPPLWGVRGLVPDDEFAI